MSVRAKPVEDPKQAVPYAVTQPDRIPAQRYYDREFYELEKERLWPRVWPMACRRVQPCKSSVNPSSNLEP